MRKPDPVKLICGMIAAETCLFDRAADELAGRFGPVDVVSDDIPFDMTDYYRAEMGSPLWRRFVAFGRLIDPVDLPDVKRWTNDIEARFADSPEALVARPINLDPGYIAPSKLVLASMKDFSHRILLRDGVYAEITLQYRSGWQSLLWTFPDYASGRYDAFLTEARTRLREQSRPS